MKKQLLVVEGNAKATSQIMIDLGARPYAVSYAALLQNLSPDVECTILHPAEDGPDCLPHGKAFTDYDGIVWTGSALNCYDTIPEVIHQIEMAKVAYGSGVPIFGSCWGLQILVLALGGTARLNPKGREIGIARDITLNKVGETHPMFAGKGKCFDTFAVHMDEVETLPPNATLLASNAMSQVQALTIEKGSNSFWGVQYHPEFDFHTMAVVYRRVSKALVKEGYFIDDHAVREYARGLADISPGDSDAIQQYAIPAHMLDASHRTLEIKNWLNCKVLT